MARAGDTASVPLPRSKSDESRVLPPETPSAGMRLGRYELLSLLARGGMAEVWLARQRGDLGFSRLVAVKTIRPELASDAEFRRMFLDEATIASRIRHANVVEVLDLGEEAGVIYLAMSYVEGGSLRNLEKAWQSEASVGEPLPFPLPISVRIAIDIASGLHAAHELREEDGTPLAVVHRDVSPQNVLVGFDGVAKLCDFGIAKALGRAAQETEAGVLKGKFSYLSPEQAERRPLDRRSDVFALGIVFWEMLTGRRLFQGDDIVSTVASTLRGVVPDPRDIVPTLPTEFAAVAMRALARDPVDRYQTCEAFVEALEAAARSVGLNASARDVGAFASSLVKGEAVARREHAARAAEAVDARTRHGIESSEETDTGHEISSDAGGSRTLRRSAVIVFGAALVVVVGYIGLRQGDGPRASLVASPGIVGYTAREGRALAFPTSTSSSVLSTDSANLGTTTSASAASAPLSPRPQATMSRPKAPKYKSPYDR